MNFFHLIFPCGNIFFVLRPPYSPPCPSLTHSWLMNVWVFKSLRGPLWYTDQLLSRRLTYVSIQASELHWLMLSGRCLIWIASSTSLLSFYHWMSWQKSKNTQKRYRPSWRRAWIWRGSLTTNRCMSWQNTLTWNIGLSKGAGNWRESLTTVK